MSREMERLEADSSAREGRNMTTLKREQTTHFTPSDKAYSDPQPDERAVGSRKDDASHSRNSLDHAVRALMSGNVPVVPREKEFVELM